MLPPASTSMIGNESMLNRSPAAMTSEPRKNTKLSPSVAAFGTWTICTPSSLKNVLTL